MAVLCSTCGVAHDIKKNLYLKIVMPLCTKGGSKHGMKIKLHQKIVPHYNTGTYALAHISWGWGLGFVMKLNWNFHRGWVSYSMGEVSIWTNFSSFIFSYMHGKII